MTQPNVISYNPASLPVGLRTRARLAVLVARLLRRRSPLTIRRVLSVARRGARPASYAETKAAREAVVAVSYVCAGREGCLPRAIATTLLSRSQGTWPEWRVGVRNVIPFAAHAWVEAEGRAVEENHPVDHYTVLMAVPAA